MDSRQKSKILSVFIEKKISQKQFAMELGVLPQTLGQVIAGKSRSRRIEIALTKLTGYRFPPNERMPRYQDAV